MALKLLKNGEEILPTTKSELRLQEFCQRTGMSCVLEWKSGQYWLHSDREEENSFSIMIDEELKRHEEYFKKSSVYKELLARAVGVKAGVPRPRILDLTAGLLGDTLLFLSFGCEVVALERHPLVALLIESALLNASHPALSRLTFKSVAAEDYLRDEMTESIIYFDPMFEDPNHKSSPRKEMRIFRNVVGVDMDADQVFLQARKKNAKRLVVKRPRLSKFLSEETPLSYEGKATRYDVYLGLN